MRKGAVRVRILVVKLPGFLGAMVRAFVKPGQKKGA